MMNKNETIKILIIDDDEDDYIIARELLYEIPYIKFNIEWVDNYETAVSIITDPNNNDYDIFLLDYHLGSYTGLQLLKK